MYELCNKLIHSFHCKNIIKQHSENNLVLLFTWRALDTIANESFGTFTTLGLVWEVITAHAPTKIE